MEWYTVDFLANVKDVIGDLVRSKGYKQPVLCLSFDSGQGKLLATGKLGDLEGTLFIWFHFGLT